jgi:hypothetical protein
MQTDRQLTCCVSAHDATSHDVAAAMVRRMLITEYYDGAVAGFLQCPACSAVYRFVTLDWSQNRFVRVIALSLLPADSMTRMVSFFAEVPPPGKWVPRMLQRPSDEDLDRIDAFLAEIVARAEPPSIVLAWNIDTDEVLAVRPAPPRSPEDYLSLFDFETPRTGEQHDWFAELGLNPDA